VRAPHAEMARLQDARDALTAVDRAVASPAESAAVTAPSMKRRQAPRAPTRSRAPFARAVRARRSRAPFVDRAPQQAGASLQTPVAFGLLAGQSTLANRWPRPR
jgi:hypothetical protein